MSERSLNDAVTFIVACAAAGGILVSFALVVVVPMFTWYVVRRLHDTIERIDDPRSKAPLAAIAATVPGASFAVGAIALLVHIARSGCLTLGVGRAVFVVLAALLIVLFARACARAFARAREAATLVGTSTAAPPRLAAATSAVGVRARLLHSKEPVVVLAGLISPVVLVSSGALDRLSDDELIAALQHELAHRRHGDQLLMMAISFCGDLSPFAVHPLVTTYRCARELAADREACRYSPSEELAAAILHLAASSRVVSPAAVCALNDGHRTEERLQVLLREPPAEVARTTRLRRLSVSGALACAILIGLAPAAVALLVPPCTTIMRMS
jgi:Zn-dependent protease with chaperone function